MIENCSFYVPVAEVDFNAYFDNVKATDDGVEIQTDIGVVTARQRLLEDFPKQALGFRGYIMQTDGTDEQKQHAISLLSKAVMEIGMIFPESIDPESDLFVSLVTLVADHGGFMFLWSSVWTPDDGFIVGPMLNQ